MSNHFPILMAANRHYLSGLALTIGSLLQRYSGRNRLEFKIVSSDLEVADFERLINYLNTGPGRGKPFEIEPLEAAWMKRSNAMFRPSVHLSAESFARLLVCEIFPDERRVAWLDSDLLFELDFVHLPWNKGASAAVSACPALGSYRFRDWARRNPTHPLPKELADQIYFNAGVLVFDLERCRELSLDRRLARFLAEVPASGEGFSDGDQFVLNRVFIDSWNPLPVQFNKRIFLRHGSHPEVDEDSPGVFHFVGLEKPWQVRNPRRRVARRAQAFLKRTGWYRFGPPDVLRWEGAQLYSDVGPGRIGRFYQRWQNRLGTYLTRTAAQRR